MTDLFINSNLNEWKSYESGEKVVVGGNFFALHCQSKQKSELADEQEQDEPCAKKKTKEHQPLSLVVTVAQNMMGFGSTFLERRFEQIRTRL